MKRAQRLLLVAFAVSLLVHAIVALLMHPPVPTLENRAEVVSIVHRSTIIAVRRTPPPPRSRPPAPRNLPVPHPRSRKGSAPPRSIGGTGRIATPAPPVVPAATAPPTTAAGCAQPNAPVAVVATPPPPDIPSAVRADATSGTAQIQVRLDATGQVIDTAVADSTGNNALDLVAVAMARAAQYSAALRDCKPVAGSYTYSVKFVAW